MIKETGYSPEDNSGWRAKEVTPPQASSEIDNKYYVEKGRIPDWIVNEAALIYDALKNGTLTKAQAQARRGETGAIFEDSEILEVMQGLVRPTFYVEYPRENLEGRSRGDLLLDLYRSEFQDSQGRNWELGDYLSENNAGVSMCMSSLDDTTAEAIRYLNEKGVPVTAWVVVEDVEGYWTNRASMGATVLKTSEIQEWAKKHDIRLQAIGFDSEKPVNLLSNTAQRNIVEMAKAVIDYRKNVKVEKEMHGDPQENFDDLIASLSESGTETEIYDFPRGLKGLLGGVDTSTPDNKRIIEMIYTNGIPTHLQSLVFKASRTPDSIPAFGIVSGKDDETPGRDFERISKANMLGVPVEEVPKGKLPEHLTEEQLTILINEWLNQDIDLDNRTFKIRELYLFAMNDAKVALMMADALEAAFEKQKTKYSS